MNKRSALALLGWGSHMPRSIENVCFNKRLARFTKILMVLMLLILAGHWMRPSLVKAEITPRSIPFDVVYSFRLQNPCTGEYVSGSLYLRARLIGVSLPNGGYHATLIQTGYSEGVGETTGIVYSGPHMDHQSYLESGGGGAVTNSSGGTSVLVSKGSSFNLILRYTFHLTIPAEGAPTSYVDNFTFECRG